MLEHEKLSEPKRVEMMVELIGVDLEKYQENINIVFGVKIVCINIIFKETTVIS